MKLTDYPAAFVEALCVHEALGRMGFSMDDVFFMPQGAITAGGVQECAVVLRTQGKQYIMTVGSVDGDPRDVASAWTAFAKRAASKEFDADFDAAFEQSVVLANIVTLTAGILKKGFSLPATARLSSKPPGPVLH